MRLHMMDDDEFRLRQQQQYDQRKHWQQSARTSQSKRTVKGRAKGFNVPMKHSRVYSNGMEKLQWSPWSYKSLNPSFYVTTAS